MGAVQASVVVQLTTVPTIALGASSLSQRQGTGQQNYSGQKTNAFFQWFLPGHDGALSNYHRPR